MNGCLAPLWGKPSYLLEDRGHGSPCWIWQGALNSKGYPCRGDYLVHRQVFVEAGGVLSGDEHAHHLCGQRACVNPGHLEARTPLAHKREHGAPIVDAILSTLERGPATTGQLERCARTSVTAVLTRMVRRGEIQRVSRGIYALVEEVPT